MPSISFLPDTYDIVWDGTSCSEVVFGLNPSAASNSYSAVAEPVFSSSGSQVIKDGTNAYSFVWVRGEPLFTPAAGSGSRVYASSRTMTVTALGATGACVTISTLPTSPRAQAAYAWRLSTSAGKLIVSGRIDVKPPGAYDQGGSGLTFVTGVTATRC